MAKGQFKDETGNVYGDLTVIRKSDKTNAARAAHWWCLCSCGTEREVNGHSLRGGFSKSCGCKGGNQRDVDPESLYKKCYRSLIYGAKDRNLDVTLEYDTFKLMIKDVCWFCGEPPSDVKYAYSRKRYTKGVEADYSEALHGIDRLDSSLGYVDGNCVTSCTMCNRMKSDFTLPDFVAKVTAINNYRGVQL